MSTIEIARKRYIGGRENPLVIRYIVFRTPLGSIFIHKLCRSDYERALHDHPWPFISIVLRGEYWEVLQDDSLNHRKRWSAAYRPCLFRHRVITKKPCWTLMLVGPRQRKWGFWIDGDKFCWWRRHNPELNICEDHIVHEGGND